MIEHLPINGINQVANAHLIASAPELLEALEKALDYIRESPVTDGNWDSGRYESLVSDSEGIIAKANSGTVGTNLQGETI